MAPDHTLVPMPPGVESRLIGNTILVGITLLVVALRIVARLVTGSKLGWDDYLILVAAPQAVGLLICQGFCELLRNSNSILYANVLLIIHSAKGQPQELVIPTLCRCRWRTPNSYLLYAQAESF